MKNKLFLLMLATGMIGHIEGAAAAVRRLVAPTLIAGTAAISAYIGKKQLDDGDKVVHIDFENITKDPWKDGIPQKMQDEVRQKFENAGFKVVIGHLPVETYATPNMVVFLGPNKEVVFGVSVSMGNLLCDPNKTEAEKHALFAGALEHEFAHVMNEDGKAGTIAGALIYPITATTMIAGFRAAKILKIKNKMGNAAVLAFGGVVGVIGGSIGSVLALAKYKRFYESRADEAVFATGDKEFIQGFKDFLTITQQEQSKMFLQIISALSVNDEKVKERTLQTLTLLEGLLGIHPPVSERIAACDKALARLEAEKLEKEKELNQID